MSSRFLCIILNAAKAFYPLGPNIALPTLTIVAP